jgi:hypothetical protein
LQVTGLLAVLLVSCASETPGAASAAANTALHSNVLNFTSFIRASPPENAVQNSANPGGAISAT